MSNSAIAIRYAKALLSISAEQNKVEDYAAELKTTADLLQRENLLRLLLNSPTLSVDKKSAMLTDLVDAMKLSDGIKAFLGLLVEKGRMGEMPLIYENYRKLADEKSGIVRAKLTSASELNGETRSMIQSGLEKQIGKNVILNLAVDAELIGGVKAEFGGRLFDGSVKTQLKQMTNTLAKG